MPTQCRWGFPCKRKNGKCSVHDWIEVEQPKNEGEAVINSESDILGLDALIRTLNKMSIQKDGNA